MTSTTAARPTSLDARHLPWIPLLVLGAATMLMVTGEMLPTVVLTQLSAGLGAAETSTGLLVSIWAGVVVLASFPLARATRSVDRTLVIAASLAVFAGSAGMTALASTYAVAVGGRVLGAAAVGLLWATVNAHVADLVPDRQLGRATAIVLGGATMGMVLGTPLTRLIADLAGWRASFWVLAATALVTAALVRKVVPTRAVPQGPASSGSGAGEGGPAVPRPGRMIAVTVLVAVVLVGHYGAYTYVTRLSHRSADALPGGMSSLLLGFGVASAAGVVLAGRVTGRTSRALVVSVTATALAVLALGVTESHPAAGILVVLGWGLASGALPPLAQTLILRLGGRRHRALAAALIPVVFNAGIAVGAALASWVVAGHGVGALPLPAAALVGLAAAGLALPGRRTARRGDGLLPAPSARPGPTGRSRPWASVRRGR